MVFPPVSKRQEPRFTPPYTPSVQQSWRPGSNPQTSATPSRGACSFQKSYCHTVISSHLRNSMEVLQSVGSWEVHPGKWRPQALQPRWPHLFDRLGTPTLHSQPVLGQLQTLDGQTALNHMGAPCIKVSPSPSWANGPYSCLRAGFPQEAYAWAVGLRESDFTPFKISATSKILLY